MPTPSLYQTNHSTTLQELDPKPILAGRAFLLQFITALGKSTRSAGIQLTHQHCYREVLRVNQFLRAIVTTSTQGAYISRCVGFKCACAVISCSAQVSLQTDAVSSVNSAQGHVVRGGCVEERETRRVPRRRKPTPGHRTHLGLPREDRCQLPRLRAATRLRRRRLR